MWDRSLLKLPGSGGLDEAQGPQLCQKGIQLMPISRCCMAFAGPHVFAIARFG